MNYTRRRLYWIYRLLKTVYSSYYTSYNLNILYGRWTAMVSGLSNRAFVNYEIYSLCICESCIMYMNTASILCNSNVYIVCLGIGYTQQHIHIFDCVRAHVEHEKKKKEKKKNARSLKKYGNAVHSFFPTFRCRFILI